MRFAIGEIDFSVVVGDDAFELSLPRSLRS